MQATEVPSPSLEATSERGLVCFACPAVPLLRRISAYPKVGAQEIC